MTDSAVNGADERYVLLLIDESEDHNDTHTWGPFDSIEAAKNTEAYMTNARMQVVPLFEAEHANF